MRKLFVGILAFVIVLALLFFIALHTAVSNGEKIGFGKTKVINGIEYDTYGFLNESNKRNPEIQYEPIMENVLIGAVLFTTIVAPIYFFGFELYQPVGLQPEIKGMVIREDSLTSLPNEREH